MKDGRSLDQEVRVGVWIIGGRRWALGERDVTGRGDEALELGHGHRSSIDQELVEVHLPDGPLFGIEGRRAHAEAAPGDFSHLSLHARMVTRPQYQLGRGLMAQRL
jgi:hypothetical protein